MRAFDVLNEVLDEIKEDAVAHPDENGNTGALIERIKRDVALLPERCNIELDDDFEDDDIGVDPDDAWPNDPNKDPTKAKTAEQNEGGVKSWDMSGQSTNPVEDSATKNLTKGALTGSLNVQEKAAAAKPDAGKKPAATGGLPGKGTTSK